MATLQLLARAGAASRASSRQFTPVAILALMAHRLEQGFTIEKIVATTNGKLIQQTRKWMEKQTYGR